MDPLTIGSALLTVGGAAANGMAQGQVGAARSGVTEAENARQSRWDSQIDAFNKKSLARYDGFQGKSDERAGNVADYYKATGGALPASGATTGVIPATSSNVLVQEGKRQNDKVAAFTDQQGKALGNLRSFGDVMGDASRGAAIDAANIGGIVSQKQGSAAVVPLEYQAANNAGNGMKMLGDIMGGIGKVGMTAGLSGADPFGGTGWLGRLFSGAPAPSGINQLATGAGLFAG